MSKGQHSFAFGVLYKRFFFFSLSYGRKEVIIDENNVSRKFSILIDKGSTAWLIFIMGKIMSLEGRKEFRRKFNGNNFVFLVDVQNNSRGAFARVMKISKGDVKSIFIPEAIGWRNFKVGLEMVLRKNEVVKADHQSRDQFRGGRFGLIDYSSKQA